MSTRHGSTRRSSPRKAMRGHRSRIRKRFPPAAAPGRNPPLDNCCESSGKGFVGPTCSFFELLEAHPLRTAYALLIVLALLAAGCSSPSETSSSTLGGGSAASDVVQPQSVS